MCCFFSSSSSAATAATPFLTRPQSSRIFHVLRKDGVALTYSIKVSVRAVKAESLSSSRETVQVLDSNLSLELGTVKCDEISSDGVLSVRRPLLDGNDKKTELNLRIDKEIQSPQRKRGPPSSSVIIDAGLEEFAKKMPSFEPDSGARDGTTSTSQGKPLLVNLDLALYKAKILARNFKHREAQEILEKCIAYWPEDGRAYVMLGKILCKQFMMTEARIVYEKGCQSTQGGNPFIWQCWAVLESKIGNTRKARELFDAATVADKRHVAAWHGWAMLELKEGNVKKSRQLLAKGIKFSGGNEYIFQTLALLDVRAGRYEQARSLFMRATKCNSRSCASWLSWAQMEMQLGNNIVARQLFEKAIRASPKNRFAWHIFGLFEASVDQVEKARKYLKIGHALNPRDPVLLQSLALLEYKHSSANLARVLFTKASEIDPDHQPVWFAWGWMEWKEGNIAKARELYQRAISIDSTSESAARCLQAWGVLEQRAGNLPAARSLFKSSLNVNSQSYVTWTTWAQLEEGVGNSMRADEIREQYFQQRTELVDDPSWVSGFLDIFDPAIDSIKKLLNFDQNPFQEVPLKKRLLSQDSNNSSGNPSLPSAQLETALVATNDEFDVDSFVRERLSLNPNKLDINLETSVVKAPWRANTNVGRKAKSP